MYTDPQTNRLDYKAAKCFENAAGVVCTSALYLPQLLSTLVLKTVAALPVSEIDLYHFAPVEPPVRISATSTAYARVCILDPWYLLRPPNCRRAYERTATGK
jgi:hypothetical protein